MEEIRYFKLLEKISKNEILTEGLIIEDDRGRKFKWINHLHNFATGIHEGIYEEPYLYIADCYTDLELYNLTVKVLPRNIEIKSIEGLSIYDVMDSFNRNRDIIDTFEVCDSNGCYWLFNKDTNNFELESEIEDDNGCRFHEYYQDDELGGIKFKITETDDKILDSMMTNICRLEKTVDNAHEIKDSDTLSKLYTHIDNLKRDFKRLRDSH